MTQVETVFFLGIKEFSLWQMFLMFQLKIVRSNFLSLYTAYFHNLTLSTVLFCLECLSEIKCVFSKYVIHITNCTLLYITTSLQSTNTLNAAYHCEWYSTNSKFRKHLCILMERAKKPVKLTAGGFSTLTLENFTKVSKLGKIN